MLHDPTSESAECDSASAEILDLWSRHCSLTQQRRQSRAELLKLRRCLGELFFAKQRHLGQTGEFQAWLRRHHIAKATAYRLIAAHQNPTKPKVVKRLERLTETRKSVAGGWELQGDRLIVQLNARQLQAFQTGVVNAELLMIPYNLPDAVCQHLTALAAPRVQISPAAPNSAIPAALPPPAPPQHKPSWHSRIEAMFKRPFRPTSGNLPGPPIAAGPKAAPISAPLPVPP